MMSVQGVCSFSNTVQNDTFTPLDQLQNGLRQLQGLIAWAEQERQLSVQRLDECNERVKVLRQALSTYEQWLDENNISVAGPHLSS